jgi:hypothetical protein
MILPLFFYGGKQPLNGYDFYLPQNLQLVFNSLQLPPLDYKIFTVDTVNVGFFLSSTDNSILCSIRIFVI